MKYLEKQELIKYLEDKKNKINKTIYSLKDEYVIHQDYYFKSKLDDINNDIQEILDKVRGVDNEK